jgi:hypothetical protein
MTPDPRKLAHSLADESPGKWARRRRNGAGARDKRASEYGKLPLARVSLFPRGQVFMSRSRSTLWEKSGTTPPGKRRVFALGGSGMAREEKQEDEEVEDEEEDEELAAGDRGESLI